MWASRAINRWLENERIAGREIEVVASVGANASPTRDINWDDYFAKLRCRVGREGGCATKMVNHGGVSEFLFCRCETGWSNRKWRR